MNALFGLHESESGDICTPLLHIRTCSCGPTDASADTGNTEKYSGGGSDLTEEPVLDRAQAGVGLEEWSVTSGGTEDDQFRPPTDETYFAFGLAELVGVTDVTAVFADELAASDDDEPVEG
ncbi:hypothetical protein I7X12_12720 [Halosimplex litoreum]|uniref:Uncharacterized protein n=1 Tax=Halosimplex litoreum TaxID=1198301 RepID=A0A7T3KTV3_9EURY|nr:hypothetical protein [Halosimplex litoreum]QPV61617.1 hypothetical protein I7X12_12720 [Halosimplex litoreum]